MQTLTALGKHYRFTLDTKWKDLPKTDAEGDPLRLRRRTTIRFTYDDGVRSYTTTRSRSRA